jgi:hypothetical protein
MSYKANEKMKRRVTTVMIAMTLLAISVTTSTINTFPLREHMLGQKSPAEKLNCTSGPCNCISENYNTTPANACSAGGYPY